MSMGGCYQVSAIDSFGNESPLSSKVCIDICEYYILPNFFTPNNDGRNDIYYSLNLNDFVKQVDMQIFNRWGQLVYETEDPDIAWDGRHLKSKELVSSGVYYYICTAYEPRITGEFERLLTGFIHVYTKNDQSTNNEK
jgi:gliding motility-associated-like protein